jgi:hypothetical protein
VPADRHGNDPQPDGGAQGGASGRPLQLHSFEIPPVLKAPMLQRAVQIDVIKTRVESAYGFHLKLQYDATVMNFSFDSNMRRYNQAWEQQRNAGRVRRHYGGGNTTRDTTALAANPDLGLPGRGDHLKRKAAEGEDDLEEEVAAEDDEEQEEEEEDDDMEEDASDSDEDHVEEEEEEEEDEEEDEGEDHVPLVSLAPPQDDDSSEEEEEEVKVKGKGTGAAAGAAAGGAGKAMDEEDILGMFDEAAKRGPPAGKKKVATWDDLPGDGDDLAAAIRAKVAKKKKARK